MKCPSDHDLELVHDGAAPPDLEARVRDHADSCDRCGEWMRSASGDELLLARLRSAVDAADDEVTPESRTALDSALARYRILGRIGAGGKGIVYEAEQLRPRRRVALKILQPGATSERALRRFEIEAEVLGRLDHPSIARVFEAGSYVSELGRHPFIAMEHVDGTTLGTWVADAAPPTRARLATFLEICAAVGHAHRKGVIHRDLKPQNVLVTADGQPKVVDFGVARLLDPSGPASETRAGQLVGTLAYMSPEQLRGDPDRIDTRTDVYALGAVLYELLTAEPLFDVEGLGLAEAIERIVAGRPVRKDALTGLKGDLAVIVAKATELEPERRYASVDELTADVRRFLELRPIRARRTGPLELGWKFARRNRVLCGGVLATLVAIAAGFVGTTSQLGRALEAERLANERLQASVVSARRAELVKSILQDVLSSANPSEAKGHDYTVVQALDEATLRLGEQLPEPEIEADVRHTLGLAYSDLGEFDAAERHLTRTLELRRELSGGADDADVADVLLALANVAIRRGDHESGSATAERCLAIYERSGPEPGPDPNRRARALTTIGLALYQGGRFDAAESHLSEALALRREHLGPDHADVANSLAHLGALRLREGRTDEAEELLRTALARMDELGLESHSGAGAVRRDLATLLSSSGRDAEACELYRRSIEAVERLLGPDHPQVATSRIRLARARRRLGELTDAEALFRQALETLDPRYAEHARYRAYTLYELSETLSERGLTDESTTVLESALVAYEDAIGPADESTLSLRNKLWNRLRARGDLGTANELYRRALDGLDEHSELHEHALAYTHFRLGIGLHRAHAYEEARLHFERVLASPVVETAEWRSNRSHATAYVGRCHYRLGELDRALEHVERSLELRADFASPTSIDTLLYERLAADILVEQGRPGAALPRLEDGLEAMSATVAPGNWRLAAMQASWIHCRARLGDTSGAHRGLSDAHEVLHASLGEDSHHTRDARRWLAELDGIDERMEADADEPR